MTEVCHNAIQSIGPPPERHADRVVAEMMRDLARKRATLWKAINEAIASSTDGGPRAQRKMAERASRRNATVLMSNHSEFDNAVIKIKMLAARKAGEPHPFELGSEAVQRYFKVTDECAQVARLKLI